jgi:hypothetical protein
MSIKRGMGPVSHFWAMSSAEILLSAAPQGALKRIPDGSYEAALPAVPDSTSLIGLGDKLEAEPKMTRGEPRLGERLAS